MTPKSHGRSGRPWRELRLRVLREEPYCMVRGPKCTGLSTTVDHVIPLCLRPDLGNVRSNLRGACAACNYGAGNRIARARRRSQRPVTPAGHPVVGDCPWSTSAPERLCLAQCDAYPLPSGCKRQSRVVM